MSGKALARLATFVIVIWCLVMLGFVGALWATVTSGAGWGLVGGWFIPALGLLLIGQALAAAAKRRGVNPATWEEYPDGQPPVKSDPGRSRTVMAELRHLIVEHPTTTEIESADVEEADEILRSYHQAPEANWGNLWHAAAKTRSLPMWGELPYWTNPAPGARTVPLSYLAFLDIPDRMRIAGDNMTAPEIVSFATNDPDPKVARAAMRNISRRALG